jgi:hypothetical protein
MRHVIAARGRETRAQQRHADAVWLHRATQRTGHASTAPLEATYGIRCRITECGGSLAWTPCSRPSRCGVPACLAKAPRPCARCPAYSSRWTCDDYRDRSNRSSPRRTAARPALLISRFTAPNRRSMAAKTPATNCASLASHCTASDRPRRRALARPHCYCVDRYRQSSGARRARRVGAQAPRR